MTSMRKRARTAPRILSVALAGVVAATLASSAGAQSEGLVPGDAFDSSGPATGAPVDVVDPGTGGETTTTPTTTNPSLSTTTPTVPDGSTQTTTSTSPSQPSGESQQPAGGQSTADAPSTGPGRARALDPFPVVRIRGRITRTGARISLLTVRAPLGARVSVRCRGSACPMRRLARSARARAVRVRPFERELRAGTVVEVSVTQPGLIGKYTRFRIRRRGAPARTDLCLLPDRRRPAACS